MTFDNLRQDVRLAIRSLLRAPAFAVVTILTLALGIGANTAIFSIVNGVILRPLGYQKPEQLMYLTTKFPALGFDQFWVSPPEYSSSSSSISRSPLLVLTRRARST